MSENPQLPLRDPQGSFPSSSNAAQPKIKTLTTLMITNISILAIVGIASILVMLFGEFDGKGIRVATTFLVFAAFTTFTALDSSEKKPSWHLPIGQLGNIYMLGLSLIQIWATLSVTNRYSVGFDIFSNVLMIIIIVKVGTIVVQKITDLVFVEQKTLSLAAKISAISFAAATILYTLPSGVGWIKLFSFDEGYWRFSTAVILLAGLSLAITVLLAWFYGILTSKKNLGTFGSSSAQQSLQKPVSHVQQVNNVVPNADIRPAKPESIPDSNQVLPEGFPEFAQPVRAALTWPVFPSGLPLPAKPNGRPDFGALREIARVYDEAEKQWFGQ